MTSSLTYSGLLKIPTLAINWLLCAVCVVAGMAPAGGQSIAGLPFVRNFPTVAYNAGILNWDIAQDKRGLLYVANNFGLLEFDGEHWQTYRVRNGTKTRSIAIDGRGRIYVGCQGDFGYFFPDSQGKLAYISLADSLGPRYRNFDETWSVYVDNDKVYFCTFNRIYAYVNDTFRITEPTNGLGHSYLVNRELYINQPTLGLGVMEGTSIRLLPGGAYYAGKSIAGILPLDNSSLLIATFQEGISRFTNGQLHPWNLKNRQYFIESIINCIIRLRNGNFAAGTQNNGVLILSPDGEILMQLTRGRGIENRTVISLHEDDLSNLWVGQNNGLSYVELGSPFSVLNEQAGLPGTGYTAFLDGDNFYLGTNTGVYLKGEGEDEFKLIENTRGQVYHIGRYGPDLLVAHHNGAMRIEGEKAITLSSEPGSWTFLTTKGNSGDLIEGTYNGLQRYTLENSHWKLHNRIVGLWESSRLLAEDPSGDIWMTHGYKGAYKLRLNETRDSIVKVSFYGHDKGFPSNLLINVYKIRNELLFTSERGVYRYNPARDAFDLDDFFSSKLGASDQMWFIQEDALNNIYFISRDHIGVLRRNSSGEYSLNTGIFNKVRKYLNDDLLSITILKNNEVLFGAKAGFIHYDPKQSKERNTSFETLIRRVSTTNDGVDSVLFYGNFLKGDSIVKNQGETIHSELPYANNSVSFTYASTSFEGEGDLTYQYYLENYEKDWSEWTSQTHKEYTNLKEGTYVFHVKGKNVIQEVSREATFTIIINPPWYRSGLAFLFYGAAAITLLLTGFNLLDRKYQRAQKLMKQKQQHELSQKDTALEKLSQQSREEITRLQNEKLESELQHKNNELATSTMLLLNKNEFITRIKNQINQILKKSGNEAAKKELLQITRSIEQNISADADWEHFQFHFDRVHGDFTNRFKASFPLLSPQDIKLSAYLRMNLSSKEIAQLLNISVRGVEISRYRLRKKLQLDRNRNLQEFILNF